MQATMPIQRGVALVTSSFDDQGQDFYLWLGLANLSTTTDWVIQFATAQQFDFALADDKGNEYWRWSTNQVFDPNPTSVTVKGPNAQFLNPVHLSALPRPKAATAFVTLSGFLTAVAPVFSAKLNIDTPTLPR